MKLFAIRQKSTGFYLPPPQGRSGRGGSHVEPQPVTEVCTPRLFASERVANMALTAWLTGRWHCSRDPGEWGFSEPSEEVWIEPAPERSRDDMEVVVVRLILPGDA